MADQNPMQMAPMLPERAPTRSGLEEMTPELMSMLAEYYGLTQDQKQQLLQLKQSEDLRKTQMPTFHSLADGQTVAANPMEQAAAAIRQYKGNTEEAQGLQKMQANILRQQQINDAYGQANLQRGKNDFQSTQPPTTAEPYNGAMMAPDPSTMTSEAVDPFATPPWEAQPSPPSRGVRKPPLTDQSPQRGRSAGVSSPLFGWGDTQGVNRRK